MRARRLALAVESQTRSILVAALGDLADRDANVLVVLAGMGCGARPQPRSSKMPAADTRAAGGTASWLTIPASTLMHSSVCLRASERKSAGIFFQAYGVGLPPPVGAGIEPAALGRFDGFRCAFQYRRCCVPSV